MKVCSNFPFLDAMLKSPKLLTGLSFSLGRIQVLLFSTEIPGAGPGKMVTVFR